MTFKKDWEKTNLHVQIEKKPIDELLAHALPGKQIGLHELISGDCANLNIKVISQNKELPLILRIYFPFSAACQNALQNNVLTSVQISAV